MTISDYPKTIKTIDKSFQESFGWTDCHDLRVLAIDEIALRKGHNYMTVVMDYYTPILGISAHQKSQS